MRVWTLAAALATMALAQGLSAQPTYSTKITRTEFNIPHIQSDSWGGVGYGVAYAYAQDNFCMLAEEFATVAGTRSLHFGPENSSVLGFSAVDNVTSDVFYRSQINLEELRLGWDEQSATARELLDGYIAGYNRYLRDTGIENLPVACAGKRWARAIDRDDLVRLNQKQMLLASSLALAPGIASAAPPGAPEASQISFIFEPHEDEVLGSNGWAFGGDVTTDGKGLLIGNPHFPWEGPARFWQMHVTGPDGYDVMGVGIAGSPIPTLGFNKDVAWTHTVTAARHFTIYMLALSPDDPTVYLVDGQPVRMAKTEVIVPMPDGADPVTRTTYSTQFGPVVTMPGSPLAWSKGAAFAIRDANSGNQRAIDTWLGIGKAANVGEIEAAVTDRLGIPWVNTIAADRHGDALHADITAVPGVTSAMAQSCSTPFSSFVADKVTLLDGTRAMCDWRKGANSSVAGLLPASEQASRTRRDYVANSNDSYWVSNPREPYRQLSPILGDFEKALRLRSRSNFTETEAAIQAGKLDHDAAKALVFGNKSLAADMVVEPLLALCADREDLAEVCEVLGRWDRLFEKNSRGAFLFMAFWEKMRKSDELWQVPFDSNDPVNTPHTLATDGTKGTALIGALLSAAADIKETGIALDAPWGEVLTRRHGERRIALHGGPGVAGVLNMQRGRLIEDGIVPVHGSSYIQIVGFDEDGPVADAILTYSQTTDPASEHYSDQTELYSDKKWHRLPFAASEIEGQREGQTVLLAE
ncbi:penicillin acylase family protein [Pontixanthobacter sp. CEM42]|uniref:penicillin acylase family protein n=1 Tax=Pontixanthobacter sp. CEM42 TaxID=2792077 RepID=UPI001FD86972|nr:penicillin acylase family protein [Pontixanthobacter sp. CEM42]